MSPQWCLPLYILNPQIYSAKWKEETKPALFTIKSHPSWIAKAIIATTLATQQENQKRVNDLL